MQKALGSLRLLSASQNLVERVHESLVEVDVFNAGKTEDHQQDVAEFLFVGFVVLSGEVRFFSAMFSQVCSGHFADFFDQA